MSKKAAMIASLACLAVVGLGINCYTCYHPSDKVRVTVTDFPRDVRFFCLVVEDEESISVMNWYQPGIGFPAEPVHPVDMGWSHLGRRETREVFSQPVQWRNGIRHGVVTWTGADEWWVYWAEGDSETVFDLAKLPATPLPRTVVDSLGLSQVSSRNPGGRIIP